MSTLIKKAISVAVMSATLPIAAHAGGDIKLYGGGATFPAVPYLGSQFVPVDRLSTQLNNLAITSPATLGAPISSALVPFPGSSPAPVLTGMLFDTYTQNTASPAKVGMSYCQTGSGAGKTLLTVGMPGVGNGSADVNCGVFPTAGGGFSAANDRPNYIGTDSPLSSTDYITNFNAGLNATKQALVQVPTIAGAVVLPVRIDGYAANVNVSTADACRIFKGTFTNWNQVTSMVPAGPNLAIRVVSRSDNSGTTYAFSNFMARNCNAAFGGVLPDAPAGTAAVFTNQTYNPTTKLRVDIAASGNTGVVAAVNAQNGAIGYADPGDVFATGTRYARVNGQDPRTTFTCAGFSYLTNQLVNTAVTTSTGIPTQTAVPAAQAALNAVVVANPSAVVTSGYPICAVTYIAAYARGNDQADQGGNTNSASALRGLLNFTHNIAAGPGPGGTWPIPRQTLPAGYAYLPANAAFGPAISQIQN